MTAGLSLRVILISVGVHIWMGSRIVVLANHAGNPDCSMQELDECGAISILIGYDNLLVPRSKDELVITCERDRNVSQCIRKNVNACLQGQPLARQVSLLMTSNLESASKARCNDGPGQQKYLRLSGCLHDQKEALDVCMKKFVEAAHRITKTEGDDQLSQICCYYTKFDECYSKVTKENCDELSQELMKDFADSYAGDMFSLICGENSGGTHCIKMEDLPPLGPNEVVPRSLIIPALKILSTF